MIETPSRILVVDDEPSITEFVSYALKKKGYETDVVDNGEDAFALASANNYDLFILDIMLPGMDGYELCRRLRSKTTAPVLFLSARDTELDKVVGLEIGGDDYLAKPFGVRELIARVRAISDTQLEDLVAVIEEAHALEQYAHAQLEAGEFVYDAEQDKYTLNDAEGMVGRFDAIYLQFSQWLAKWEV